MFKNLFPNSELQLTKGIIQSSGTSVLVGTENKGPQRWVKVNDVIIAGLDDGLYHAQEQNEVAVVYDGNHKMVAWKNFTAGNASKPNYSGVIGAFALSFFISATLYLFGVWNFIWKKGWNLVMTQEPAWWITVIIIFLYSCYAVFWTGIFMYKEYKRQKSAHEMIC